MDEVKPKDGLISNLDNDRKLKKPVGKPKGLPKSGGRKAKPIELKDTSQWDDVLKSNLFNIPQEAIKLYFNKDTSNPLKFSILQFLAAYTTPAIKPIEKDQQSEDSAESQQPADVLAIVGEK